MLTLIPTLNAAPPQVADFDRVETGADGTITAIQSTKRGTETVKLCTPVPTAGRPILEWLQALLAEVRSTMAQLFTASYKEGDTTPLLQLKAPQATTLLLQQVRFTALVEAALRAGDLTQLEGNMEATIADLRVAAEPSSQWNMAKTLMTLAVAQLNTVPICCTTLVHHHCTITIPSLCIGAAAARDDRH